MKLLVEGGMLVALITGVNADTPRVTIGHGVAIVETNVRMEARDGDKWSP